MDNAARRVPVVLTIVTSIVYNFDRRRYYDRTGRSIEMLRDKEFYEVITAKVASVGESECWRAHTALQQQQRASDMGPDKRKQEGCVGLFIAEKPGTRQSIANNQSQN